MYGLRGLGRIFIALDSALPLPRFAIFIGPDHGTTRADWPGVSARRVRHYSHGSQARESDFVASQSMCVVASVGVAPTRFLLVFG